MPVTNLAGMTLLITGASRGIGKAIALRAARDGANIVVAAKTAEPHPKLPGTIYTAAKEIEAAGGNALPCVLDVRDEKQVRSVVQQAVDKFGGIDILVNNASAISLTPTLETEMKRYDLMHNINTRGTFLMSKECLPYLKKSSHPHILNLSPPLNMNPGWFANHVAYTMAKYGMSMCVLGMHEEFRNDGIGVNALWPMTAIHTAAIEMLSGSESANYSRKPDIMSDAAYHILTSDPKKNTGNFYIDEDVLKKAGITDLTPYAVNPKYKDELMKDFFIDENPGSLYEQADSITGRGKSSSTDQGKVGFLFKKIGESLNPQLVSSVGSIYQFVLTGNEAGKWYLDLKNAGGKYGQGEPSQPADCTLTMDSNNFFSMFEGKLKPSAAYMTGKLKISGNLQKALKLEKLMGKLKAKL